MVEDSNLYSPKEGFSKNIISTEVGCGCSYAVVHLYIHIIAQNSYGLTIPPYIIQTVSGVVYTLKIFQPYITGGLPKISKEVG